LRRAGFDLTRESRMRALVIVLAIQAMAWSVRAETDEYKKLTDAAVEEHSLGHYEEARALFAQAHAIAPSARTFWGMGIAAFEARDYVDAIELLAQAREDSRKPLTAAQRTKTDSLIERAQAYVVRLPLHITPSSARAAVDGKELVPNAEGVVLLDAGAYQVVVSAAGYQEAVRSMTWHAGDAPAFEVHLQPLAVASPVTPALVAASAGPVAATPAPQPDAAPPRTYAALKWTSLGVTVASLGVMGAGIGMRASEVAYYNDESNCPGPDKDQACPGKRQDVRMWEAVTIVGGAAAGVFGALTAVFFVLDKRSRAAPAGAHACGPAFELGAECRWRF
jgi:hypothetical protein